MQFDKKILTELQEKSIKFYQLTKEQIVQWSTKEAGSWIAHPETVVAAYAAERNNVDFIVIAQFDDNAFMVFTEGVNIQEELCYEEYDELVALNQWYVVVNEYFLSN